MMADVSLRVTGLRELGAKMRGLSEKVNKSIAASATGAAAKIVKTAAVAKIVSNPSVRTGSLRDAVIVKKVPRSEAEGLTSAHYVTVRGRGKTAKRKGKVVKLADAPHASLVEFGTVNMPAEPFLRPALTNNLQRAADAMKDRLAKRIEAASK